MVSYESKNVLLDFKGIEINLLISNKFINLKRI